MSRKNLRYKIREDPSILVGFLIIIIIIIVTIYCILNGIGC